MDMSSSELPKPDVSPCQEPDQNPLLAPPKKSLLRKAVIARIPPCLLYGSDAWYSGRARTHTTVRGTKIVSTRRNC